MRFKLKMNIEEIRDAKILTLTPYAVEYSKESCKLSNNYKVTGEEIYYNNKIIIAFSQKGYFHF